MTKSQRMDFPAFTEHRVQRDRGSLYIRDFPGSGPAFVLLHGFPDNSHIYDDLIPHLALAGRRTVSIDFLGFGASTNRKARTTALNSSWGSGSGRGGLGAREDHPCRPRCRWPGRRQLRSEAPGARSHRLLDERVLRRRPWTTCSRAYRTLREQTPEISHPAFLGESQEFAWLLAFQRDKMQVGLTEAQKARYHEFLGPIIDDNFRQRPGAGPAFAQMTYQYTDEVAANTARLADFRRSGVPLLLIWGKSDPYLHVTVAEYMRSQARNAAIHILEAGHWPQIDEAADVARIMLASR